MRKIIFSSFFLLLQIVLLAGPKDSIPGTKKIPFVVTYSQFLNPDFNADSSINLNEKFRYIDDRPEKALKSSDIVVSGVVRSLMIYREMSEAYNDMITGQKNISFSDYPSANIKSSARLGGGYPFMELNFASRFRNKVDFNVGYSITPVFTGDVLSGTSRTISARQNINFSGKIKNGLFESRFIAGEVLWLHMSRFTMGAPEYRDNYFNRLPWDWHRNSFERFEEYYSFSSNIGAQQLGSNAVSGLMFETRYLPLDLSLQGFFGRTSWNVNNSEAINFFPSFTTAYKMEKVIFERGISGNVGFTFYAKRARVGFIDKRRDDNTIASLDFDLKIKKINVSGEFALGQLNNPTTVAQGTNNSWAPGFFFKTEFDNRVVLIPFSIEYYSISNGLASMDGSILNSNPSVGGGGYATEKIYDNNFYLNVAQEVGMVANNRQGVDFKADGGIGKILKFQLGYSFGSEISNLHDSITIQHRINDFSRSRMRPWFSADGPYHRIQSNFFRTFEVFTIDPSRAGASSTYLKGFNAVELLLKTKFDFGKHSLILLNFTSYNSVRKGFQPLPSFPNDSNLFISVLYESFTAAFSINPKLSVVSEMGFQIVKGSTMIDLSPDKTGANKDRIVNQLGTALAFGIDYDINRTMNVHLRERYFTQKDFNFYQDVYAGHETTFELKIFF
jgi:hypothetical protein